jgi:peptidylprolyl isomerase
VKKLILVLAIALLAVACGGSDASDTAEPAATETSSDASSETAPDEAPVEPPAPIQAVPLAERDCAHSVAELEGGAEAEAEVPMPPNEKPPVDETFLGDIAELTTTDLIEGTGREAQAGSTVQMQYVGVLGADGTEFDASWDRGQPFSFTLGAGQVISGWDDGIVGMKVGGRRVLQIPSAQAYGEQARGDVIVANSDLVFVVDLLEVSPPPEPAPPIDDDQLGSFGNLEIIDLVVGEGCTAEVGDIVRVNYVGVDAETGDEFDSSWGRGVPFALTVGRSQVIDGWNEGIAGMKVGGERILQIPGGMAYGEGDLVFRVHLEGLTEAPLAHQVTFEGNPPDEVEVSTLTEGSGATADSGAIIDTNVLVMLYRSGVIAQSTWQDGETAQLALQPDALLPGLEEGLAGIQEGELRQIIVPPEIAYPAGVPANAGLEENDALVFFVEPLRITNG